MTEHHKHLNRLKARLPAPIRRAVDWLLRPSSKWLRIPLGVVLILGGFLGFLPILGFWMVPLGALLLAEDIPVVRRATVWAIDAVSRWWNRRIKRRKRSAQDR
jgi:hypothetical protein